LRIRGAADEFDFRVRTAVFEDDVIRLTRAVVVINEGVRAIHPTAGVDTPVRRL
jgi:hypothetical protein